MLREAVAIDDPVIFCEHKFLYRRLKDELPGGDWTVPLGQARVAREGSDVTVVTWSKTVHIALDAAEQQRLQELLSDAGKHSR